MSEDDYTRPERSSEINLARRRFSKRYKAIVEKRGLCTFCKHRDRETTYFGRTVCRVGQVRQYPQCQKDGKGVEFETDATAVEKVRDAA